MSALARLTCKAFLDRQPPQKQKRLLSFLPAQERQYLSSLATAPVSLIDQPFHLEDALDITHPSWMIPFLEPCTSQELGFYLASLQSNQANVLKTRFRFLRPLPSLTSIGETFLRDDLLKKIIGDEDVLPLEALPPSPQNTLTKLPFRSMVRLIYLLGLRDLGYYLRFVIDKTLLKNMEKTLSGPEWQIVQKFASKKDPLAMSRSGFEAWQGEPEKLRILIEQRGINRLAKALFPEDPSLIWYVKHIMDAPRANFFSKLCVNVSSKETQDLLKEQVRETVNMISEQKET